MTDNQTDQIVFRPPRRVVAVLAGLGVLSALLAILIPLLLTEPALGFLLMSMPLGLLGYYLLTRSRQLSRSFVGLGEAGLELHVPRVAGGWLFAQSAVRLGWDEISGVTCAFNRNQTARDSETVSGAYEYIIQSTRGNFTLTKALCARPHEVVRLIVAKKGFVWDEPVAPAVQDEAALKAKTAIALTMLSALVLTVFMIAFAGTPPVLILERVLAILTNISLLAGLVMIPVSLIRHYLRARQKP